MTEAPTSKISKLRAAAATGDWRKALRIAAKFPRLGEQKEPITRAWAALQSPGFYAETGQDPAALVEAGIAALRARYGL